MKANGPAAASPAQRQRHRARGAGCQTSAEDSGLNGRRSSGRRELREQAILGGVVELLRIERGIRASALPLDRVADAALVVGHFRKAELAADARRVEQPILPGVR